MNILGHQQAMSDLANLFQEQRLFHSCLFAGPKGVGKMRVALWFVQLTNCEQPSLGTACGECSSCLQFARAASPDKNSQFYKVLDSEGSAIKLGDVKELHDFIYHTSWVNHRFIVIDDAEKLTPQAANSLLKVVEEPPKGVHFIFITPSVQSLLPTLRSRSFRLNFQSLGNEDLKVLYPEVEPWMLSWSMGRPKLLQELMNEQGQELRGQAVELLKSGLCGQFGVNFMNKALSAENREFFFHCLLSLCRDLQLMQANSSGASVPIYNEDQGLLLGELVQSVSAQTLYDSALELMRNVSGNVDKGLASDRFLYRMSGQQL